jgi:hypothetical protein
MDPCEIVYRVATGMSIDEVHDDGIGDGEVREVPREVPCDALQYNGPPNPEILMDQTNWPKAWDCHDCFWQN